MGPALGPIAGCPCCANAIPAAIRQPHENRKKLLVRRAPGFMGEGERDPFENRACLSDCILIVESPWRPVSGSLVVAAEQPSTASPAPAVPAPGSHAPSRSQDRWDPASGKRRSSPPQPDTSSPECEYSLVSKKSWHSQDSARSP